ncbi:MAG TPA: M17 family peptidase N-terminal domain-containing protein, partial [Polyangia bacterium]|nr:M17 family peptidase N-terminal domain-containing protein [Polyangia bacterium]
MDITLSATPPLQSTLDVLAVVCHEDTLPEDPTITAADTALGGHLRRAMADERFRAKAGQSLSLHTQGRLGPGRLLLVGCGPRANFRLSDLRPAAGRVARFANSVGAGTAGIALGDAGKTAAAASTTVQTLAEGLRLGGYRFQKYLTGDKRTPVTLTSATLFVATADESAARQALDRAQQTARAVADARDLVNEPAGVLTPTRLAEAATTLARDSGLGITVFGPDECRQRGMGLYLAVAQGSDEEPRFIHLTWKPAQSKKRIVLVGKG